MVALKAGLDWTATPSLNEPFPYGPSIVGVENAEELELAFRAIGIRFGFEGELKGHNSSGEVLTVALQAIVDCRARVGVLLLDKSSLLLQKNPSLPNPAVLRHQMACALVERFIEKHPLARLLCDEDIRGQREWNSFRTDILRCNRRLRPDCKIKVAAWPSHQNVLIQAADVVAYVFSRWVRGGALEPELRELLRTLQEHNDNLFLVEKGWNVGAGNLTGRE
jgi:hypothetical protein